MKEGLSHVDERGRLRMVDVSGKPLSDRTAIASGKIRLKPHTLEAIERNQIAKGNVFAAAELAGIQAAKRTAELIPLCHPLPLSEVAVDFETNGDGVVATCRARTVAQTGVEMEALVGVANALLTIYDMCKAIDETMEISNVRLARKTKRAV